jgi:DNA-binding response OmpR family regulator
MISTQKQRILAYGTKIMLYRLSARLNKDEVILTGCSEASETIAALSKGLFDMVIVDHLARDAETICQAAVSSTRVPVVLMIRESDADWKQLRRLEVDGYLFDEAGSLEMMARIRALSRRKAVYQPV